MFLLAICVLHLLDLHSCPNGKKMIVKDVSTFEISRHLSKRDQTMTNDQLKAIGFDLSDSVTDSTQKLIVPTRKEIDEMLNKANWKLLLLNLIHIKDINVANPDFDALIGIKSTIGNVGYIIHYYTFLSLKAVYSERVPILAYFHGFLPDHFRYNIFLNKVKISNKLKNNNREECVKLLKEIYQLRPDLLNKIFTTPHPPFLNAEVLTVFSPEHSANMVFQFSVQLLQITDCHKLYDSVIKYLKHAVSVKISSPSVANTYFQEVELIMYYLASRYIEVQYFERTRDYFAENLRHLLKFPSIARALNIGVPDQRPRQPSDSNFQRSLGTVRRIVVY